MTSSLKLSLYFEDRSRTFTIDEIMENYSIPKNATYQNTTIINEYYMHAEGKMLRALTKYNSVGFPPM